MNDATSLLFPALILLTLIYGAVKKVDLYESFASGIKQTLDLLVGIFPYVATILVMTEVASASGVSDFVTQKLFPVFNFLGVPPELTGLIMLKPFTGSGSLAMLSEIFKRYGADSYVSRCAACIFGSSETTFYVSAVYFSACKKKSIGLAVIVSLVASLIGAIASCLLCRIM